VLCAWQAKKAERKKAGTHQEELKLGGLDNGGLSGGEWRGKTIQTSKETKRPTSDAIRRSRRIKKGMVQEKEEGACEKGPPPDDNQRKKKKALSTYS